MERMNLMRLTVSATLGNVRGDQPSWIVESVPAPMLTKCANADCGAPFNYREGRLFRQQAAPARNGAPSIEGPIQHFWLCAKCADIYRLDFA
jgi:hypothetical protein